MPCFLLHMALAHTKTVLQLHPPSLPQCLTVLWTAPIADTILNKWLKNMLVNPPDEYGETLRTCRRLFSICIYLLCQADTLCSPVFSEIQILVNAQRIRKQRDVNAPLLPTTGSFRRGSKCQSFWGFFFNDLELFPCQALSNSTERS